MLIADWCGFDEGIKPVNRLLVSPCHEAPLDVYRDFYTILAKLLPNQQLIS